MPRTLERTQLAALSRGFSVLGSGGGGKTTLQELLLSRSPLWPISVHEASELDPAMPCVAVGFVGSTHFLHERLPGEAPFSALLTAAERWTGSRAQAVCALEGGGMNGLAALALADDLAFVDADLTGRAFPHLYQMSILVDRLPGVFAVCDSGAGGVVLIDSPRAEDIEKVIRASVVQAGGVGAVIFAGFTVGALVEHAITGIYDRALRLGSAFESAAAEPFPVLASRLGGRMMATGRVTEIEVSPVDAFSSSIELTDNQGDIVRIIARSESLAIMRDGRVEAATPEVIVAVDSITRAVLQADELTLGRPLALFALPSPEWWTSRPERLRHVAPAAFGLSELSPA